MGLLGAYWLVSLVDARTPLLVADAQGIRIRLGRTWRGLPWTAVHHVEHTPRRGPLRDGRLVVVPHNLELIEAELTGAGKRHVEHLPPAARRPVRRTARTLDARRRRRGRPHRGPRPRGPRRQPDRRGRAGRRRGRGPESAEAPESVDQRRGSPRRPRTAESPRSSLSAEPEVVVPVVVASPTPAALRESDVGPPLRGAPRRRVEDDASWRVASCAAPAGSASWRRPSRGATASARSPGPASRSSRWCSTTSRSSPPRTRSSDPSSPQPAPAWA